MAGGIYLPALPVLEKEFHASATAINLTVSVFMLTFAFAVSVGVACGSVCLPLTLLSPYSGLALQTGVVVVRYT
jgi:hypothetical protein